MTSTTSNTSTEVRGRERIKQQSKEEVRNRNEIPSPHFDASTRDLPLKHAVLDDPEKQIRLLSRSSNDAWHLSIWSIDEAPSYAALSYEWGAADGSRQSIRIDGRYLRVTPNCALALRQLWACTGFDYFWIDAICIDQTHHNEKGHQVRAMADIYIHATCTMISLGSHDVHSLHSFDAIQIGQRLGEGQTTTMQLDSNALQSLYWALDKVGRREYWHRLWVYQELLLSCDLTILCGRDALRWWSLADVLRELESCLREPSHFINKKEASKLDSVPICPSRAHTHTRLKKAHRSTPGISGFQTLLDICERRQASAQPHDMLDMYRLLRLTRERKCLDPRDKVFGVMRLVEWPRRIGAMKVDYNQGPFEVAIEVLKHYPPGSSNTVAHAVTLVDALQLRGDAETLLNQEYIAVLSRWPLPTISIPLQQSTPLRQDPQGLVLQGNFRVTAPSWDTFSRPPRALADQFRLLANQDGEEVGLVSIHCRPEDILLELAPGMHLVVRAQGRRQFKILGHTILQADAAVGGYGTRPSWSREGSHPAEQASYEVQFQVYDLLLWACLQPRVEVVEEEGCGVGKVDWKAVEKLEARMDFHAHFVSLSRPLTGSAAGDVDWERKQRILDRWEAVADVDGEKDGSDGEGNRRRTRRRRRRYGARGVEVGEFEGDGVRDEGRGGVGEDVFEGNVPRRRRLVDWLLS